ncbi:hypothetical protein BC830DRAFT_1676 [Chytriomyces sp. MP71]|nr:hypothetical protein BC830DRAFT_1676 [Chytriomyces sp. MP71]
MSGPIIDYSSIPALATFVMGVIATGSLLHVIRRNATRLLASRIGKLITFLIATLFLFSIVSVSAHILLVFFPAFLQSNALPNQILGALLQYGVNLILSANLLIALERYYLIVLRFSVKGWQISVVVGAAIAVSAVLTLCYAIEPTFTITKPAGKTALIVAFSFEGVFILLVFSTIAFLYTKTTNYSTMAAGQMKTEVNLANCGLSKETQRLEHRVFQNSVLVAGILFVCYCPAIILAAIEAAEIPVPIWCWALARTLVGLDCLLTPMTILYLKSSFRKAVLFEFFGGIHSRDLSTTRTGSASIGTSLTGGGLHPHQYPHLHHPHHGRSQSLGTILPSERTSVGASRKTSPAQSLGSLQRSASHTRSTLLLQTSGSNHAFGSALEVGLGVGVGSTLAIRVVGGGCGGALLPSRSGQGSSVLVVEKEEVPAVPSGCMMRTLTPLPSQ